MRVGVDSVIMDGSLWLKLLLLELYVGPLSC